jgi:hypothetical protein
MFHPLLNISQPLDEKPNKEIRPKQSFHSRHYAVYSALRLIIQLYHSGFAILENKTP